MNKLLVFIALPLITTTNAQVTEGVVKYTIKIEGNTAGRVNPMTGNTQLTLSFKKDKSLSEMTTPVFKVRSLNDGKNLLILTDIAGQKFYMRKTKAEGDIENTAKKRPDPVVEYTKEKKIILGYVCTKVMINLVNAKKKPIAMTAWYTDKIRNIPGLNGPGNVDMLTNLKGMVLEADMADGPAKVKMIATEISVKPVPDVVFAVSTAGYLERKAVPVKGRQTKYR